MVAIPRPLVAVLALFVFVFCALPAYAQKTVHVKEYKRKDGTIVKAHDRKAPSPKGTSSTGSTTSSSGTNATKATDSASPTAPSVALTPAPSFVALKLKSPLPNPDANTGVVVAVLASGATIRLRAQDIDYRKTGSSADRVFIQPVTFTQMSDGSTGRAYMNLTFADRYWVTAWQDDVAYDAMPTTAQQAEAVARGSGLTFVSYSKLVEGLTVDEVTAILGVQPIEESRAEIAGTKTILYKWKRDESVVVAMFKDGRLFSKLPFALR